MMANARWLLTHWLILNLDYLVLIEGHADDKGSREDNIAIAELRAKAARALPHAAQVRVGGCRDLHSPVPHRGMGSDRA
jgi:hypothetical protein